MSIQDINLMHDMYLKQLRAENSKMSMLKKDELPPRVKFAEGKTTGRRNYIQLAGYGCLSLTPKNTLTKSR